MSTVDISLLAAGLKQGSRRSLAKALTLIESKKPDDRHAALTLLEMVYPHRQQAQRIGISGPPGVGKSTFIEALGSCFLQDGKRLAILAVDPSSPRSAGSILGDKTRMELLANHDSCFIRPSPAGLSLGGVARRTHESILICEAAGYDSILIETVGVGQSEHLIASMVDVFSLLALPHAGDQLQGIKRGILELVDLVIINKADGPLLEAARRAAVDHKAALHWQRPEPDRLPPEVLFCSALEKTGIDAVYQTLKKRCQTMQDQGLWHKQRNKQDQVWYRSELQEQLMESLANSQEFKKILDSMRNKVAALELPPPVAAHCVITDILRKMKL